MQFLEQCGTSIEKFIPITIINAAKCTFMISSENWGEWTFVRKGNAVM